MILPKRILLSSVLGASTMSAGDWNIEADYQAFCANCHGASGAGDGQAALAMGPPPANFSDPRFWIGEGVDQGAFDVIKRGGAAAGLSAAMPAWGDRYDDARINIWVRYLRQRFAPGQTITSGENNDEAVN
ncbi:MAG: c-type cytochrome [Dokdonella sp.]|nr:c-type cytochrome [Dokdonella sp.]MCB1573694.1 c-type cytochrome [Xanthomonadales bacterium]